MSFTGILSFARQHGLNVIPCKYGSKTPLVAWKEYQKKKFPYEELQQAGGINLAFVCGSISDGLVVVDLDDVELYEELDLDTTVVKTNRGYHIYFKSELPITKLAIDFYEGEKIVASIDVRGEGFYVLAPPSLHPSGATYAFLRNENIMRVQDLRAELIKKAEAIAARKGWKVVGRQPFQHLSAEIQQNLATKYGESLENQGLPQRRRKKYTPPCIRSILEGVQEGERDEAAFTLGCFFLQHEDIETVRGILEDWNSRNNPPLEQAKLFEALRMANKRDLNLNLVYKLGCSNLTLQRHCRGRCKWRKRKLSMQKSWLRFDICQLQTDLKGSQKCAVSWKLCPKKRRQGMLTRGCYTKGKR